MATIDGTVLNDILDGTEDPDVINGLAGNDTLNGNGGSDTLNGGAGTDTLNGGEGDDTLVSDQPVTGDRFDGGNGTDTLELRAFPIPVPPGFAASSVHTFSTGSLVFPTVLSSIERLVFASQAGQTIQASINAAQLAGSGITEIVAGAGRDLMTIFVSTPGSYSLGGVTFTGWSPAPVNAWDAAGDGLTMVAATPFDVTLNAAAGLAALQTLAGSNGNDTLNGSANADRLNGGGGINQLFGNDGNDLLLMINQAAALPGGGFAPPTNYNGAGSLFDGGSGTDAFAVGGYVNFVGTLQSIEGIILLSAVVPVAPGQPRQDPAVLEIDSARVAMLPTDAFFMGVGTVLIHLDDGLDFDGSSYVIAPGSAVSFGIAAGDGDGVSIVGTSGSDRISFGAGNQTANGGAGGDLFAVGDGTATVLDFTQGQDRVDLAGTGLTTNERLADFLTDQPGGARIAADSGGQHYELNLQGVAASGLSEADFQFDTGFGSIFEFGTGFDDVSFGYQSNDEIHGGEGNDRIYSGGGLDRLFGDGGNDTVIIDGPIQFGFPPPVLDGGTGYDTLVVRPSALFVDPQFGALVSFAGTSLSGFEALKFDSRAGASAAMQVIVGAWQMGGMSTVIGGAGADTFIISANLSATNTYNIPVLNLVDWSANDAVVLAVGTGTVNTTLNSVAHSGRYALVGGSGNDTFNGSSGAEVMIGNAGDDTFTSGGGGDNISGGLGNDTALFSGNFSDHTVFVTATGQLIIDGSEYSGIESFMFGTRKYVWDGTQLVPDNHPPVANADAAAVNEDATVTGNVLNNDSTGETDPDSPDVISVVSVGGAAITAATVIQGLYGVLTIAPDGSYSYVANADVLDALPAGTVLTESFAYAISDSLGETAESILSVEVTAVSDLVTRTLGSGSVNFSGTGADEVILAGRGEDRIHGMDGSDRIYGNQGDDRLYGDNGFDLLSGGSGDDRLYGGNGDDLLIGGRGDDLLTGGAGADTFEFGRLDSGEDRIADFELGIDQLHLSDGVFITRMKQDDGSTVLFLSSGAEVELTGLTGLTSTGALFAGAAPPPPPGGWGLVETGAFGPYDHVQLVPDWLLG